jgi:hypothetical protein
MLNIIMLTVDTPFSPIVDNVGVDKHNEGTKRQCLPRKNFLPSLSMWKIVHKFPGKAETEI